MMTPFEDRLLDVIADVSRRTGRPARTIALAAHTGIPERTVRWWLVNRMEPRGVISRPSPRGGWTVNAYGLQQ
jgi:Mn-dependent DtxR family transcriptional regulator